MSLKSRATNTTADVTALRGEALGNCLGHELHHHERISMMKDVSPFFFFFFAF